MEFNNKASEKIAEVAELPLKLNLQLFADEVGDEGADDAADVDTIDTGDDVDDTLDTDVDDDDQGANNPGAADPDQNPSFKDDPQNKAFAEMRRRTEQAERDAQIARKYGAEYGVFSEAEIAAKYGDSHGIRSLAELEKAIQTEQYRQQGIDPDAINQLIENHPAIKQANEENFKRLVQDNYLDLQKEYPELVKKPEDVSEDVFKKWNDGKSGLTLTEAYELVNRKSIREHLQASSKQKALNQVNSKSHLRSNGGDGADDVDLTSIPADTLQTYRQLFAKELRTGKMKESDFVKHYKKSTKG
jgi:hypothetical protein